MYRISHNDNITQLATNKNSLTHRARTHRALYHLELSNISYSLTNGAHNSTLYSFGSGYIMSVLWLLTFCSDLQTTQTLTNILTPRARHTSYSTTSHYISYFPNNSCSFSTSVLEHVLLRQTTCSQTPTLLLELTAKSMLSNPMYFVYLLLVCTMRYSIFVVFCIESYEIIDSILFVDQLVGNLDV